jgi:hypothetical protein
MFRKTLIATVCLLTLGLAATRQTSAQGGIGFQTRITFRMPVGLPGVSLGAGAYVFERPLDGVENLVRVRSVDGSRIFLTALTDRVSRPADLNRGQVVTLGESRQGAPQPVMVWWPPDSNEGYQFRYGAGR